LFRFNIFLLNRVLKVLWFHLIFLTEFPPDRVFVQILFFDTNYIVIIV
jgi:hypothetical protein